MIETQCKDCGQRFQLGTVHVCPKKTAAKKLPDIPTASKGSKPKSDTLGRVARQKKSTGLAMLAQPGSSSSLRHNQVPESGSIPGPVEIIPSEVQVRAARDEWPTNHPDSVGVFIGYAHPVRVTLEELLAVDPKPRRGRPRVHPDRKAYKAAMERKRRLKLKEAKP